MKGFQVVLGRIVDILVLFNKFTNFSLNFSIKKEVPVEEEGHTDEIAQEILHHIISSNNNHSRLSSILAGLLALQNIYLLIWCI